MRRSFIDALFEQAKKDPRIIVITADMGFELLEKFQRELPGQIINGGVSEANCMSMAAGMALAGRKAYVYSITPFVTYRSFEQARVDVCYHNADVKIVGVGSGLDYAQSGSTHHATEDIAIMRSLPNMKVVCPADPLEAGALPARLAKMGGPVYVRLGRGREKNVHKSAPGMEAGKAIELMGGEGRADAVVFCTGNISKNAYDAVQALREKGHNVRLSAMSWIKPLDERAVANAGEESGLIVTVEEHNANGGLYGAVCEAAAKHDVKAKIRAICLQDVFVKEVGDAGYLRAKCGLDAKSIESRIAGWILGK